MRFVLDTNVIIAALRSRRGASNALLIEILRGKAEWLCSVPLFLEYQDVMNRPAFLLETGYSPDVLAGFLTDIASVIEPVEMNFLWRPQLRDPNDEMVLETAANGRADGLVTFNKRDFDQAVQMFSFALLTPQEALNRIRS